MRGLGILLVVAAGCLVAADGARADEDWNCGGAKIIEIGMSQDDVLANCGTPTAKSVDEQAQREGRYYQGATAVERWTYATDTVTTILTFDKGKLIGIETGSTE